uniref:DUF5641 domain-containing protein n=1 Tax=Caenorhabditis japonica TaxID=281687 RepID=A0A8R1EWP9_CAEJA
MYYSIWTSAYLLTMLESHHKNKKCSAMVPKVDQVVMVWEDLTTHRDYNLGRILELIKSPDGKIRKELVRIKRKKFPRSVCHLIPLEIGDEENRETEDNHDPHCRDRPQFDLPTAAMFPRTPVPPLPIGSSVMHSRKLAKQTKIETIPNQRFELIERRKYELEEEGPVIPSRKSPAGLIDEDTSNLAQLPEGYEDEENTANTARKQTLSPTTLIQRERK